MVAKLHWLGWVRRLGCSFPVLSCHCWVCLGWPVLKATPFQNIGTLQLTVTLHGIPWPIPAVPVMHLKFGVCSFVNVTFVFVNCLFISWAKQHWETWTRDPLLKNQWWKSNFLTPLWTSRWYKWELQERMFRLNLCCQRCWRYRPWIGQKFSFLASNLDD